ncbi:MAG: DUF4215 domain-containing protein, partial [Myxococcota bacterium]
MAIIGIGLLTGACSEDPVPVPFCGDGLIDGSEAGVEECDDANLDNNDLCLNTCMLATCGDGFVRTGIEECDDGNLEDGDGCSATCTLPNCGNGVVDLGEECDDANAVNTDSCLTTCALATCGDGFVLAVAGDAEGPVEECDDGNLSN